MHFKILFLSILLIAAGCGDKNISYIDGPYEMDEAPLDPVAREKYLSEFPLLNEFDEPFASRSVSDGVAPFGVLLRLATKGRVGVCTVTHVRKGIVLTNAHCVRGRERLGPQGFYVVFYSRTGEKVWSPVTDFVYVGRLDLDDIALLRIQSEASAHWDVAESESPTVLGAETAPATSVRLWAFDPFDSTSPTGKRWEHSGMKFSPRICTASRKLPTLEGIRHTPNSEEEERVNMLQNTRSRETMHVFIDHCDHPPIGGNSGALITEKERFSSKVGVYHWGVLLGELALKNYNAFEYRGNDGVKHILSPQEAKNEIFGVGTFWGIIIAHTRI